MKKTTKVKKLLTTVGAVALGAVMGVSMVACGGGGGGTTTLVDNPDGYYSGTNASGSAASANGNYTSQYKSLEEVHEAGSKLNTRLAEEGMVLLKNANSALPLKNSEKNVTLFGYRSANLQLGGGGSGAGLAGVYGVDLSTLESSMTEAGFKINNTVLDLYKTKLTETVEPGMEIYTSDITASYANYKDAAIVTVTRSGSEGSDLLLMNAPGHADTTDHSLELTDNEKALIRHIKAQGFTKIIVLLNTSNIMEMTELQAAKTADNLGVDAILQIGHVGNDGARAIGRILNGTVNPSAHTVDTWAVDFKKSPSWNNFGLMTQNGAGYDNNMYIRETGEAAGGTFHSVEYREDIYMGYRFYETVAADLNKKTSGSGDTWYNENVLYPFGYGLSYTTFAWELDASTATEGNITSANSNVTVKVKVTNTGSVAGKDVVQVYATAPYTSGGIEKAEVALMGFEKTKLLKPGESEVVTVQFVAQDMASFDWNDKNNNNFNGYELEAGTYKISARRNSHDEVLSVTRTVGGNGIQCKTDYVTGNDITPIFSQAEGKWADYNSANEALLNNLLSRKNGLDGSVPAASTKADRTISQSYYNYYNDSIGGAFNAYDDDENDPWYIKEVPADWTQATAAQVAARANGKTAIQLSDMTGVNYSDATIDDGGNVTLATDAGSQKWNEFMNQLSWEELMNIWMAPVHGSDAQLAIGKPMEAHIDGPAQLAMMDHPASGIFYDFFDYRQAYDVGTFYVSNTIIGSTWNKELAQEQGAMVGDESLFTNCVGWYGPSVNIHRSPFGGRNFEYFSEDGVLSGLMVGSVVKGSTEKGVICYLKHMFLNDQETNREEVFTWATEQAIREIYLKPFEIAVKAGGTMGIMTGKNRIGAWSCYSNGAVNEGIMRGEWDFQGCVITDFNTSPGRANHHLNQLIRNGVDMTMSEIGQMNQDRANLQFRWDEAARSGKGAVYAKANADDTALTLQSATQYYWVRTAVMHQLWASANANSISNPIFVNNDSKKFDINVGATVDAVNLFTGDMFGGLTIDKAEFFIGMKHVAPPDGVTVSADGKLTVANTVEAGTYTFTVKARARDLSASLVRPYAVHVTVTLTVGAAE